MLLIRTGIGGREMCRLLLFLYMHLRSKMLDDARMMLSIFFSWGMETNRHRSGGGVLVVKLDFLEFWICRKHCYVIWCVPL